MYHVDDSIFDILVDCQILESKGLYTTQNPDEPNSVKSLTSRSFLALNHRLNRKKKGVDFIQAQNNRQPRQNVMNDHDEAIIREKNSILKFNYNKGIEDT